MTTERVIDAFKYLYDKFKDYKNKDIESWGIIDECITEWVEFKDKNHKYRWHDLRKNPNDFPIKQGEYYVAFKEIDGGLVFYDIGHFEYADGYGFGWHDYFHKGIFAWREIELVGEVSE